MLPKLTDNQLHVQLEHAELILIQALQIMKPENHRHERVKVCENAKL